MEIVQQGKIRRTRVLQSCVQNLRIEKIFRTQVQYTNMQNKIQ